MNQSEHNASGLMDIFTHAVNVTGARLVATEEEALEAYASIVKSKLAQNAGGADDKQESRYKQYELLHKRCISHSVNKNGLSLGAVARLANSHSNNIEAYGLERGWLKHSDGKLYPSEEGINLGLVLKATHRSATQRVQVKFTLLGFITTLMEFE